MGGQRLRCEEGGGTACAHLREGARCQLELLLKQGAQHLVLPFQVKHPLLQLDALLSQVLPPPGGRRRARWWGEGEWREHSRFIKAVGTPAGHALLLQPPMKELSLPIFMALASSGDGKFSKVYHSWSEVIPFPLAAFSSLERILCLLETTHQRRAHVRQGKTWVKKVEMTQAACPDGETETRA